MPVPWFVPEQGVRLIRTSENEHVVSLERICDVDDEEGEQESAVENTEE